MVKCLLDDCECDLLWDTDAQVSIISVELLQQHLGQVAIRQLSELLDTNLNLTAVDGIKVPYIGWGEVSAVITEELLVPFLVISEKLDCPILGYNAIEELVSQDRNPKPIIYIFHTYLHLHIPVQLSVSKRKMGLLTARLLLTDILSLGSKKPWIVLVETVGSVFSIRVRHTTGGL